MINCIIFSSIRKLLIYKIIYTYMITKEFINAMIADEVHRIQDNKYSATFESVDIVIPLKSKVVEQAINENINKGYIKESFYGYTITNKWINNREQILKEQGLI